MSLFKNTTNIVYSNQTFANSYSSHESQIPLIYSPNNNLSLNKEAKYNGYQFRNSGGIIAKVYYKKLTRVSNISKKLRNPETYKKTMQDYRIRYKTYNKLKAKAKIEAQHNKKIKNILKQCFDNCNNKSYIEFLVIYSAIIKYLRMNNSNKMNINNLNKPHKEYRSIHDNKNYIEYLNRIFNGTGYAWREYISYKSTDNFLKEELPLYTNKDIKVCWNVSIHTDDRNLRIKKGSIILQKQKEIELEMHECHLLLNIKSNQYIAGKDEKYTPKLMEIVTTQYAFDPLKYYDSTTQNQKLLEKNYYATLEIYEKKPTSNIDNSNINSNVSNISIKSPPTLPTYENMMSDECSYPSSSISIILSEKDFIFNQPIETKKFTIEPRSEIQKKAMATYQALANLYKKYPQDADISNSLKLAKSDLIQAFP